MTSGKPSSTALSGVFGEGSRAHAERASDATDSIGAACSAILAISEPTPSAKRTRPSALTRNRTQSRGARRAKKARASASVNVTKSVTVCPQPRHRRTPSAPVGSPSEVLKSQGLRISSARILRRCDTRAAEYLGGGSGRGHVEPGEGDERCLDHSEPVGPFAVRGDAARAPARHAAGGPDPTSRARSRSSVMARIGGEARPHAVHPRTTGASTSCFCAESVR